jgi:hypothetical protein
MISHNHRQPNVRQSLMRSCRTCSAGTTNSVSNRARPSRRSRVRRTRPSHPNLGTDGGPLPHVQL